jgi:hypothetical protein
LTSKELKGFFEGDGGFQVKVDRLEGQKISFRPIAKFGQNNRCYAILLGIAKKFNVNITTFETTKTGSLNSSVVLPLKSAEGAKFLAMYADEKPINPGTRVDLAITRVILDGRSGKDLPLGASDLKRLELKSDEDRERCVMLTLLVLKFRRAAQKKAKVKAQYSKGDPLPIEYWFTFVGASSDEIAEAEHLGDQIMAPILDEVQQHVDNLEAGSVVIDIQWLAYYFLADGSFKFEVTLADKTGRSVRKKGFIDQEALRRIKVIPECTITDDRKAIPLLKAIKKNFGLSAVQEISNGESAFVRAQGWGLTEKVTFPLFDKMDLFPELDTKYKAFKAVCKAHREHIANPNAKTYREFVKGAYFLNISTDQYGDNSRRTPELYEEEIAPCVELVIKRNKAINGKKRWSES